MEPCITTSPATWRVLAIDDEPDNLHLVLATLRFRGAVIEGVRGGAEALAALDIFKPNLILLDLSMPKISGWEVHRIIRSRPMLDCVPVIALTAHAMPNDESRVKAAGFDGYITKPFRVQTLLADVARFVEAFLASHPRPKEGSNADMLLLQQPKHTTKIIVSHA